jgi:hypothetical protein
MRYSMTEQRADSPRRPGRPRGSSRLPVDFRQDVWLEVEVVCEQIKVRTGRRPPITMACDLIARRGGLKWIVGGNVNAIAAALASERKGRFSRWRRFKLWNGRSCLIVTDKAGCIIVAHLLQNASTLRSRYVEANRLVRESPAVKNAWTNMLRDRLGLPRHPPINGRFAPIRVPPS